MAEKREGIVKKMTFGGEEFEVPFAKGNPGKSREELEEIMNLSDRIAVIYKGTVQKVLRQDEATKERLGILMAGVKE